MKFEQHTISEAIEKMEMISRTSVKISKCGASVNKLKHVRITWELVLKECNKKQCLCNCEFPEHS